MIISGEASGELYGSLLATELKKRQPEIILTGVGGERMEKAGVKVISKISGTIGFIEALSSAKQLIDTYRLIKKMFKTNRPDLIVLIDFPDFNLMVAKTAKAMGIKVLYYVSPQVWLWRSGRVNKIARLCDRIAVILPFEEAIYKDANIPCKFVGHPVMEEIQSFDLNIDGLKKEFSLDLNRPVCAILPGSRHSEMDKHLPILADTLDILSNKYPDLQFIMPLASAINWDKYSTIISRMSNAGALMVKDRAVEVLSVSDIALVASGTATLQTALLGVPMVIFYKVSPLSFFIGTLIMKIMPIGLPNILAGRLIVPELLQETMNVSELVNAFEEIYNNSEKKKAMSESLLAIRELFIGKNPSQEAASMIMDMLK
ncbi:MAG: lipid-A-disaccharide synthase [Nitrospirae bacterium]|nr:lipid-A-disaccharide synthase [Nitrospirota bacterium]